MYFGDDALQSQMVRMDQLTEFRLKFGAVQYLENLRNEVLTDSGYKTEDEAKKQQELVTEVRQRILQRIQAEILKRIIPTNRNSHLAVKLMKCIQENHFKMTSVHKELQKSFERQDGESLDEFTGDLEEKNQNITMENCYKKPEEKQQGPMEETLKKMIKRIQVDLLRKMLPPERTSKMATQFMKRIQENHSKLVAIHQELLNKLEQRDDNAMKESIRKLEEANQNKWRVARTEWSQTNREKILYSILVGLVRKIRNRRCPQMAAKIMKKLQDQNLILHRLQEELVVKVKERESLKQTKQIVEKELVMKVKMLEKMKETRKRIHLELMNYHLEKNEWDDEFVPRKLFLTGANTFRSHPKLETEFRIEKEIMNEGEKEPSTSRPEEQEPVSSIKRCASNPKRSIKNRIKRFFGMK